MANLRRSRESRLRVERTSPSSRRSLDTPRRHTTKCRASAGGDAPEAYTLGLVAADKPHRQARLALSSLRTSNKMERLRGLAFRMPDRPSHTSKYLRRRPCALLATQRPHKRFPA